MSNSITVDCAVCGQHSINVPARAGTYRVRCPNADELGVPWAYSATLIRVFDDGTIQVYSNSPS